MDNITNIIFFYTIKNLKGIKLLNYVFYQLPRGFIAYKLTIWNFNSIGTKIQN